MTTIYTYDAESRVIRMQEGSLSTIALIRDAKGQVTSASRALPLNPSLTNSGTTIQTFDAASQVASSTYDSLGRLTNDGARSYTWDLASRLTSYTQGGSTVTFTYDATGKRLTRTTGGVTRSYVFQRMSNVDEEKALWKAEAALAACEGWEPPRRLEMRPVDGGGVTWDWTSDESSGPGKLGSDEVDTGSAIRG